MLLKISFLSTYKTPKANKKIIFRFTFDNNNILWWRIKTKPLLIRYKILSYRNYTENLVIPDKKKSNSRDNSMSIRYTNVNSSKTLAKGTKLL